VARRRLNWGQWEKVKIDDMAGEGGKGRKYEKGTRRTTNPLKALPEMTVLKMVGAQIGHSLLNRSMAISTIRISLN